MEQVRLDDYADWGQYEDWFPLNVGAIYRWLGAEGRLAGEQLLDADTKP